MVSVGRNELTEVRLHSPVQEAEAHSVCFLSSLSVSQPVCESISTAQDLKA